jgi:hypothetical protein
MRVLARDERQGSAQDPAALDIGVLGVSPALGVSSPSSSPSPPQPTTAIAPADAMPSAAICNARRRVIRSRVNLSQ